MKMNIEKSDVNFPLINRNCLTWKLKIESFNVNSRDIYAVMFIWTTAVPKCASRNFRTNIFHTGKVHPLPENLWPSPEYRMVSTGEVKK